MKKKEISTNSIIKHLYSIEKEEKLNEKESQNYATEERYKYINGRRTINNKIIIHYFYIFNSLKYELKNI